MIKIAITTSSFAKDDPAILNLIPKSMEVLMNPHGRTLKPDELVTLAADAAGIVAGTEKYDATTLAKLKNLKVISRVGVGIDGIDLAAAKERGVKVFNTPDGPTQAVAEHVIGLMLGLLRKTHLMDQELRLAKWKKEMGNLLSEKNVGIIGMGRIGRRVSELARAFGATTAFYDIAADAGNTGSRSMELPELLKWADIVTLHCSAKDQLLGAAELASMKKGSWLINTARGTLIDEAALTDLLRNGHLAGAALDVFGQEPYSGPLTSLSNVILTPHIGSYAKESRIKMESDAIANLMKGLGQ